MSLTATIITGLLGLGSNLLTNYQNKRAVKAQQEYNERQQLRAMEYNSPLNMKRLYQSAGINPITYVGGLGNQAKINSLETEQAKVQPLSQDVLGAMSSLAQMSQLMNQTKITEEQLKGMNIENAYKEDIYIKQLENMQADTELKGSQRYVNTESILLQRKKLEIEQMTADSAIQLNAQQIKNLTQEIENKKAQQVYTEVLTRIEKINAQTQGQKNKLELNNTILQNNKLIKELSYLAQQEKNAEVQQQLLELQRNLGVANMENTKLLLQYQTRNEGLKPFFEGGKMALDFAENFIPTRYIPKSLKKK